MRADRNGAARFPQHPDTGAISIAEQPNGRLSSGSLLACVASSSDGVAAPLREQVPDSSSECRNQAAVRAARAAAVGVSRCRSAGKNCDVCAVRIAKSEDFMRTPASIARHPIHPMIVPLPIGLWVFSLVCDLIHAFGAPDPVWKTLALYTMVGGLIGALAAAVPGLIDLLSLPPGPRRTAIVHMSINLVVVAVFAFNAWMRVRAGDAGVASSTPVWLSILAIGLLLVSGWLGGKLVYEGGVAVDTESLQSQRRP
jgi:uncharacterized membrane protein